MKDISAPLFILVTRLSRTTPGDGFRSSDPPGVSTIVSGGVLSVEMLGKIGRCGS